MHIEPQIVSATSAWAAELFTRHDAFWTRAETGSLLRSVGVFAPSVPVRLPQPDGSAITHAERLTPEMVDPESMIAEMEREGDRPADLAHIAQRQSVASLGIGDLAPFSQPFFKIPWLEAMLGCPITMTEGQIWVERHPGGAEAVIGRRGTLEHDPWFQLYLEFLHQLDGRLGDRYPVTTNTLLRGTSDLAAAVMGVRETCVGWLDDPTRMARLLRVCTDANLAVIEAGNRAIRPFAERYMSGWGILAPAPVVRTQADHSSLLSPALYEKQILPFDLEVIRASPSCILHLHNNGLHVAPYLVQVPELDVLQVVIDPYPTGSRKGYEVEMMQMMLAHKPLIVDVNAPDEKEAAWLLDQLPHRGLCFNARFDERTVERLAGETPEARMWVFAGRATDG